MNEHPIVQAARQYTEGEATLGDLLACIVLHTMIPKRAAERARLVALGVLADSMVKAERVEYEREGSFQILNEGIVTRAA